MNSQTVVAMAIAIVVGYLLGSFSVRIKLLELRLRIFCEMQDHRVVTWEELAQKLRTWGLLVRAVLRGMVEDGLITRRLTDDVKRQKTQFVYYISRSPKTRFPQRSIASGRA